MVFACGLSNYEVGIFHLSNHAFFKALLFLGAGSIIHAVSDEQDMRKMGGLKNLLPFSYGIMVIGSLALIGFPFFSGFYSKDTILEMAFAKYTVLGHFCYYLGSMAAFFTAFYSTRLLFLVFLAEPNGNKKVLLNAHEGTWRLTLPLLILCVLSISIGFFSKDVFIGFGTNFWNGSLFILPNNYLLADIEFIDLFYKLLPLILTLLGVFFAYFIYFQNLDFFFLLKQNESFKISYNFLNRKWYYDRLYNQIIGQNVLMFSYFFTYKTLDRGIVETFGPSGIIDTIKYTANSFKFYQTGNIFHYLFFFFISIILILFIFILLNSNLTKLTILLCFLFLLSISL
jgi:NADH-ubiquinone oxidoreductase chain 5